MTTVPGEVGTDRSAAHSPATPEPAGLNVAPPAAVAGWSGGPDASRAGRWRALLAGTRPEQWLKNALVLAAPLAAGQLVHPDLVLRALLAGAAFVLVSGGTYLLNDVRDRDRDRLHPVKCRRPVASGALPVRWAVNAAVLLAAAGLLLAALDGLPALLGVTGYLLLTSAYSFRLKRVPWVELAVVTAGFWLRPWVGGLATGVPLSGSFLLVTGAGALLLLAGKRWAELHRVNGGAATRPVLRHYSRTSIGAVLVVAALVVIVAYPLWALSLPQETDLIPRLAVRASTLPVWLGVLRYVRLLHAGAGEAPEALLRHDRLVQVLVLAWLALFSIGLHHG